ncbi:MAG: hypothetical protein HC915_05515 [Anaerolineae bacterium]|nr:hypothetical protein [Anaerolineae bacterium]
MPQRTGYAVLLLLGGIALAGLILNGRPGAAPTPPAQPANSTPEGPFRLFPFITDSRQIEAMALELPAEDRIIRVEVDPESGAWVSLDDPSQPVDEEAAHQARLLLANLIGEGQIERAGRALEAFGFQPQVRAVLSFHVEGEERPYFVFVGDATPSGVSYYVSLSRDVGIIILVPAQWVNDLVLWMMQLTPPAVQPERTPTRAPG